MKRALTGFLLAAASAPAAAPGGTPIEDNDWTLALHQGPVVGSVRVLGLGGSYVGVGEGVEGIIYNPASLANRSSRAQSWFEWDISFDWLVLGTFGEVDFFNDGPLEVRYSEFRAGLIGLGLQFGRLGIGSVARGQAFQVGPAHPEAEDLPPVDLQTTSGNLGLAWTFDWLGPESLVLGLGVRTASLEAAQIIEGKATGSRKLLEGNNLQTGALWRPAGLPWRLGVAFRLPSRGTREEAAEGREESGPVEQRFGDRWLPDLIEAPWELAVGFSWMFGPFGPSYNSLREAVRVPVPGGRRLVTVDTVIAGAVEHAKAGRATGPSGFVEQQLVPSRTAPSVSLRFGVEDDLFPTRLRVRGGAYVEPARFEGVTARLHGTGGLDLRLSTRSGRPVEGPAGPAGAWAADVPAGLAGFRRLRVRAAPDNRGPVRYRVTVVRVCDPRAARCEAVSDRPRAACGHRTRCARPGRIPRGRSVLGWRRRPPGTPAPPRPPPWAWGTKWLRCPGRSSLGPGGELRADHVVRPPQR